MTELEYIIFQLCGEDILKKKEVEQNYDILDFLKWNLYKSYNAGLQEVMRQILESESKKSDEN